MSIRSFLHSWMAAALLMSLLCSLSIPAGHAGGPVAASPHDIVPLQAGDTAPAFVVTTVDGKPYAFEPQALQKPVLLLSFRGGWCPYCNTYLSEMRHVIPEIRAMEIDVLFLSGDRPSALYDGLKSETRDDIDGLDYTILSDDDASAAIALGIAFTASQKTLRKLRDGDYDIAESSVERHNILPVPAVFAIDSHGIVQFAFTNADYKVRLPADELLRAARRIAAVE